MITIGASFNAGNLLSVLLGFLEMLQYLVFFLFFNTEIPPAPMDFVQILYENSIELGAVLNYIIIKLNIKDFAFALHYDLDV